ncbi:discoidin domain-containing protein [Streptomyces sp. BE303]|uniref:discoidin domain-containing protein n=1 Tax=Streptomyces sp. BE303 TaxID=3002528 RepID=UPI002E77A059|nr:discoidin domain-containing protein [Streptomyces sp. BE303]MED7952044.1 discoidin domain-containing protein [Streptomyces sp. BE303]
MFNRPSARPPADGQDPSSLGNTPRQHSAAAGRRTRPHARLAGSLATAVTLLVGSVALNHTPSNASTPPAGDPTRAPYDLTVDAPVLIVLGQSNAVGFGAYMNDAADRAQCGSFSHVKGLNRQPNLAVGATAATWSPYTCRGTNLGYEFNNGYSYNVASVTALRWERAVNAGAALPDLNVIHVAWQGQGTQETDGTSNRWWPDRDPTQADSLHQLTLNTIGNALRALQEAGKRPRVIGMHWNQWEAEAAAKSTVSADHVQQAFLNVLEPLRTITGTTGYPVFLYRPRTTVYQQVPTQHVVEALTGLAARPAPNPYTLIDPADATSPTGTPLFQSSAAPTYGIFNSDGLHYTRAAQEWFADRQWKTVFTDGLYGAPVTATVNAAQGRPASQSSTWAGVSAARAVDGNIDGTWPGGSVSRTSTEPQAWWQADLGATRTIRDVRLLRRTDCCDAQITDFSLVVSATDLTGRSWADIAADPAVKRIRIKGTAPKQQLTIPVGSDGRFVRVQLTGTDFLSLAEVKVDTSTN